MRTNRALSYEYPATARHNAHKDSKPLDLQRTPGALARKSMRERDTLWAGNCLLVFPSRPHVPESADPERQNLHFMIVDAKHSLSEGAKVWVKRLAPGSSRPAASPEQRNFRFLADMSVPELAEFCAVARAFLHAAPVDGMVGFHEAHPSEVGKGGPRSMRDEHWHCIRWRDTSMISTTPQAQRQDGAPQGIEPGLELWAEVLKAHFTQPEVALKPPMHGYAIGTKFADPVDGARIHPQGGIVLEREREGVPTALEMARLLKEIDAQMHRMHREVFSALTENYDDVQSGGQPLFTFASKAQPLGWLRPETYQRLGNLVRDCEAMQMDYHKHPAYSIVMHLENGHFKIGIEPTFYAIRQERNAENQPYIGAPGQTHAYSGVSLTRELKRDAKGEVDEESIDPRQRATETFIEQTMKPALEASLGEDRVRWRHAIHANEGVAR
jgi:hypothetical protein